MAGRVVVVGSVNVDLVVATARLPGPGETVTGGDVARHHGGKGGNQAVAAARLGASVAFVGAVGEDDFGLAARSALAAEGIDVTHLATASRPTGVALIVVDARAENLIAVAPGANASPTAASVAAALDALAVGPGDVVLASCEIPARRGPVRPRDGAGRRRGRDPEPGAGGRAGRGDDRPRRHPDPERGGARPARLRRDGEGGRRRGSSRDGRAGRARRRRHRGDRPAPAG